MRRLAFVLALLCLLIGFWGVWNFEFLSYDDPEYVSSNPVVLDGLDAEGVRWAFTTDHAANWHPLTWITLMADRSLFGPGPFGFHLMNLVWHALAVLALWAALRALGLPLLAVILASCLFAAHPTRLESVAWVSERKDVLSALFGWLALWRHALYVRTGARSELVLSLIFLALGLLSKPMLVSWPLLLLVVDVFLLHRPQPLLLLAREKLPHFAIAIAAGIATVLAQSAGGAIRSGDSVAWLDRISNAMVALVRYPLAHVWPVQLSFFVPHPALLPGRGSHAIGWIVLAAVGILLIAWGSRRGGRSLWNGAWLGYLVTILPVLGLLQVGPQAWADRYLAIPGVFLSLALWAGLERLVASQGARASLVAVLCATSAVWTHRLSSTWSTDDALYTRAIEIDDANWLAHGNLGRVLQERGDTGAAERHFRAAIAAKPDDAISRYNLGTLLLGFSELSDAELQLRAAIAADPHHAEAHNNLAQCLARGNRYAEALPLQRRAVELQPRNPEMVINLADLERRSGAVETAVQRLNDLLRDHPQLAGAHDLLARIHFENDPRQAVSHAMRAVELTQGRDARLLETLAQCQRQAGLIADAVATAQRGLEAAVATGDRARADRLQRLLDELR